MTANFTTVAALNIRAEMARRRITQSQVAEALGLSQAAVSARLRGITPLDVNELASIAALFGVSPASLMVEVSA